MQGSSLEDVAKSPTDASGFLSFSILSAWPNLWPAKPLAKPLWIDPGGSLAVVISGSRDA
jgi:hypothetical protein